MKFKDIFERYKNGQANSEEIEFINEEIEKNEIINDYLAEMISDDFNEEFKINDDFRYGYKQEDNSNIKEEANDIKNKVDKKMKSLIYRGIATVFILLFLMKIFVSPIISVLFYNPSNSASGALEYTELYLDSSVFTELHFPGYLIDNSTESENLGFGMHNIEIVQTDIFNENNIIIKGKSKMGNVDIEIDDIVKFPKDIFYEDSNKKLKNSLKEDLKLIEELPKSSVVSSYIEFKNDIDIDKLLELEKKYNLDILWVGVDIGAKNNKELIGFNPSGTGTHIVKDEWLYKLEYLALENKTEENKDKFISEVLETHFKSMLEYMGGKTYEVPGGKVFAKGREKFIKKIYNIDNLNNKYYKDALDYVNENGINTYGIKIMATRDLILDFLEDDIIENIYIDDVKLSVLEK